MTASKAQHRAGLLTCLLWVLAVQLLGQLLAAPGGLLAVPADAVGPLSLTAALTAGMVIVLVAAAVVVARPHPTVTVLPRALSLRTRSLRTAFLSVRDPDAKGRARPRAPSAALAAA